MAKRSKKSNFKKTLVKNYSGGLFGQIKAIVRQTWNEYARIAEEEGPRLSRSMKSAMRSGGSGLTVLSSQRKRNWSSLSQNLGKKILRMGNNVDPAIQQLAADAVNGTGDYKDNAELENRLRDALGISRSGAGWLNKTMGSARRWFSEASRAGVLFDVASRGGAQGGLASAELLQTGADTLEDMTRSKGAQRAAEMVADKLVRDPLLGSKLLTGLGRLFRVGGALGSIAHLAYGTAQGYFEDKQGGARADMAAIDARRKYGVGAAEAAVIRQNVKASAATGVMGWFRETFGYEEVIKDEKKQRAEAEYKLSADSRKVAAQLGVNVDATLRARAAEIGVPVNLLSPEEVQRTIGEAAREKAYERVSKKAVTNALVDKKLIANINDVDGALMLGLDGRKRKFDNEHVRTAFTTPEQIEAAIQEIKNKVASDIVKDIALKEQQKRIAHELWLSTPEGAEYTKRTDLAVRDAELNRRAYLKRKQVSWVD